QFREAEFEKLFDAKATGDRKQEAGSKKAEEPERQATGDDEKPAPKLADQPEQSEDHPPPPIPHPPSPAVEIVFEAIERRLRFLTPTQMDAGAQCISPDSHDLIFRAIVAGKANLWAMPLDEPRQDQPPRQLTSGPSGKGAAQFAPD